MIIGIAGKKGCGKDTLAEHIKIYGFEQKAFATPLKEVCKILFNLSDDQVYGDKKEEIDVNCGKSPRYLMQFIGTDLLRKQLDSDIFVNAIKYSLNSAKNYVISDIRFKNEADMVKSMGGIVIFVDRNTAGDCHESEQLNDINYDYYIENNGTISDLYEKFNKLTLV
jgi:hypothetical protein